MQMLRRKLKRDILDNKATFAALCFIIAVALCVFVGMNMTMRSLNRAITAFYADYRLADVFATVEAFPASQTEKLLDIPGIAQVTTRLVQEERVLFEDNQENIYLRLTSYQPNDLTALNQASLYEGQPLAEAEDGVYVSPGFAAAHDLQIGDKIPILLHGQRRELPLLGTALSPEYVYAVSGKGDIFPNEAVFGVAMVPQALMEELYGRGGQVNSLSFRLALGSVYEDVEVLLRDALQRYNLQEIMPREDQISYYMLDLEVSMMQKMGLAMPLLLLGISSIMLVITLKRRVEQQRGQIGILLAFGYSHREIRRHYLEYGLLVGLVGGVMGMVMGIGVLNFYVAVFREFFSVPGFEAHISGPYIFLAPFLAMGFSMLACAIGCRGLMRLAPAEAMRPPAPQSGGTVIWERIPLFWNMLSTSGKMAVRNLVRTPFRSFVSLLGVALVYAMMAVVFSFTNLMEVMISDQYEKVEVYDLKVTFNGFLEESLARRELNRYPGVELVETMLELPCQLRYENLSLDTVALGLPAASQLYQLLDDRDEVLRLGPQQAALAQTLAQQLEVGVGDTIYIDSGYFPEARPLVITAVVPQYVGSNIYLNQELLWQLVGAGQPANAAMLLAPAAVIGAFQSDYRLSGQIRGISRADEMFAMVNDYLDAYIALIYMLGLGVGVIGFVIVYNSAVISFSERSRELASLLVLGLYEQEAAQMVSFEQWLLAVCGMLVGLPLSFAINGSMARMLNNDIWAMPAQLPPAMLLLAAVVTCGYLFLAQLRINRKMRTLVIVDVLKERE